MNEETNKKAIPITKEERDKMRGNLDALPLSKEACNAVWESFNIALSTEAGCKNPQALMDNIIKARKLLCIECATTDS